jgi:hypothetical protein
MDRKLEETVRALLAKEGPETKECDLERFGPLLEQYVATLETLRGVELGEEEIAGIFHPQGK